MIRFLLDEHVPRAIARGLRNRGVEVLTVGDADLLSATDELIVEYAFTEGYVIFTQDEDFLRIHSQNVEHAGIVYSKQGRRTFGELVQFLKLIADCITEEEMVGAIEYV